MSANTVISQRTKSRAAQRLGRQQQLQDVLRSVTRIEQELENVSETVKGPGSKTIPYLKRRCEVVVGAIRSLIAAKLEILNQLEAVCEIVDAADYVISDLKTLLAARQAQKQKGASKKMSMKTIDDVATSILVYDELVKMYEIDNKMQLLEGPDTDE